MRPGTHDFSANRLKEAREARGLSMTSLADMLHISRQSISAYERAEATPHPQIVELIADKLSLPVRFFLDDAPPQGNEAVLYWRSMAATTKVSRDQASRRHGWLRRIVAYLSDFVDMPPLNLPPPLDVRDVNDITDAMIEEAARTARQHFALGLGPVKNITWLLENHGVIVSYTDLVCATQDSFSEVSHDGHGYAIVNNGQGTAVRYRFDLAHELGHLILHRNLAPQLVTTQARNPRMEEQAHRFAAEFLMPSQTFASSFRVRSVDGLRLVKATWRVSMQAALKHAQRLGLLTPVEVSKMWRSIAARGWRRMEPLDDQIPAEEAELLRSAFATILASGTVNRDEILAALPFDGREIERLCGLQPGTLVEDASPVLHLKHRRQEFPNGDVTGPMQRPDRKLVGADVISFDRRRK